MKVKLLVALLMLSFNFLSSQEIATVETIEIQSKELLQNRKILVYTPKTYQESSLIHYDVIYVFDAQNREFFDFTHSAVSFVSNTSKAYIVVGITSTYNEQFDYARNNDLLPVLTSEKGKERYGKYSGNAAAFLKYVSNEVIPFIEKNYRTKTKRLAVGHSLSASFMLYAMLQQAELFDSYFAISPNFAYDEERLAKAFINHDFTQTKRSDFIYISNANEGESYWQEWKPAREKVYAHIDAIATKENATFIKRAFPKETHWSTFAPSLLQGFKDYFEYEETQEVQFSQKEYEVIIQVKVPNASDVVYISGNQEALGNWNPQAIQMSKVSDFQREIKVNVRTPVEFKITKGSWDTQALLNNTYGFENIWINPTKKTQFQLEVLEWANDE